MLQLFTKPSILQEKYVLPRPGFVIYQGGAIGAKFPKEAR
jgi:hypothetical protein